MSTSVSSVTKHFPSAENGFTTTTSGSVSSGAATVGLNSVAGYTNGETVVFVIDPTDASKKQTFTGVIDTAGVQVTGVVWTAGSNVAHASGATVVDYATATHISMMTKGILVDHDQSGQHKNLTDANGNEWIKQTATASAVNEITVANAATGNAPVISATGGDTNIYTNLLGKGTGTFRFAGPYDGWNACNETLTYASATTFTCSSALAGVLSVGDKIKLTQTTAKYFYVTGISGTTVTVTGGSDYSLANAAITLPFFSKESTPTGFPTSFTDANSWKITSLGGVFTYRKRVTFTGVTVNTAATALTVSSNTLPVGMATIGTNTFQYSYQAIANAGALVVVWEGSSSSTATNWTATSTDSSRAYTGIIDMVIISA